MKNHIPLPPLPEQHRIVNKIEELFTRLDAGVEALKKIQLQLKRYRQSVLKAAFEGKLTAEWREAHKSELEPASVLLEHIKAERKKKLGSKYKELPPVDTSELPELPEGWGWASLAQISWNSGYGTSEKCAYESTGYPVLRIPNIVNNKINLIDLKFTKSNLQLDDREQLSIGDLLVIRTNGSKDLLGRYCFSNSDV